MKAIFKIAPRPSLDEIHMEIPSLCMELRKALQHGWA
jgi:hypothetical protein